jgi:hypothetical protein
MKMEQTECSETSAYKIQTPGELSKRKQATKFPSLDTHFYLFSTLTDIRSIQYIEWFHLLDLENLICSVFSPKLL